MSEKARPYPAKVLKSGKAQRVFADNHLLQVAMPMGGIGAGCICLNGCGGLQDFSIRRKPATSALPGHHTDMAFALLRVKGKNPVTKLLEGPVPAEKIYNQGINMDGYPHVGSAGMPHFDNCAFQSGFPFGEVSLSDPDIPLKATITGWNPFIPLDDKNSGIPCAILEYTLKNPSKRRVEFEFSYHLSHLAPGTTGKSRNSIIPGSGVFFSNEDPPNSEPCGTGSLTVIGATPAIKAMWLRGGWFDAVSALWREVSEGTFRTNDGLPNVDSKARNGGSILIKGSLKPGQKVTYPVVITWHFPNCHFTACQAGAASCICEGNKANVDAPPAWRPYYVSHWKDARDVAEYVKKNYASLRQRTVAFKDALFSSTLPPYVVEAVASNLAIIKSPTVLRQENGNLWAWEGCCPHEGCCPGSCTHVWNYAQAFPNLYPKLERTFREQELERSMDERGHVTFRAALPDGPPPHDYHAASDGQLGGIMKLYRDWQISGDLRWLKRLYPLAKRSLQCCIQTWDPDHRGALFEPHHNTYDIEFWGPDGMCTSIYLGALTAMAEMARGVGKPEDATFYEELASKGAKFLDENLFNGEYYFQKVMYEGLRNTSFAEAMAKVDKRSSEAEQLMKKEGPNYQYGTGCISDGVIGAWMAKIYGIDTPQTAANIRKHLKAVFQYNFKHDLSRHVCTQRPGYAMGHEPALVLCTWPRGGKPTLPFVYSDEVWTGIEYQVASHLIAEGFVAEGLTIVKAVRSRYDGRTRNPFNEYECGNYYARALSSYALLSALSGFRYSAAKKMLWFGPKINPANFKMFFSTASGFGTISLRKGALTIEMLEGELAVDKLFLTIGKKVKEIDWGIAAKVGKKAILKLAAR